MTDCGLSLEVSSSCLFGWPEIPRDQGSECFWMLRFVVRVLSHSDTSEDSSVTSTLVEMVVVGPGVERLSFL